MSYFHHKLVVLITNINKACLSNANMEIKKCSSNIASSDSQEEAMAFQSSLGKRSRYRIVCAKRL